MNWTSKPEYFPDGLKSIQDTTKWPVSAHNRYWDGDTIYASQNGGKYNFHIGTMQCL